MLSSIDQLLAQLPGVVFWQDLNFTFQGCNQAAIDLFGFKDQDDMLGNTPLDFRCAAVRSAETFMQQDREACRTKSTLKYIILEKYHTSEFESHFVTRKPILEQEDTKGVFIQGIAIENKNLLKMVEKIKRIDMKYPLSTSRGNYLLSSEYHDVKISNREAECMFYLIRGKTAPEIANLLNISKRTIESYIDNIKLKMYCTSKQEVCDKAINLGFLNIIPESIIASQNILDIN